MALKASAKPLPSVSQDAEEVSMTASAVLSVIPSLAFAPLADAFLVVVSEGKTSRDVLKKGVDILQELPVLGVVLNRSEEATSGYYY